MPLATKGLERVGLDPGFLAAAEAYRGPGTAMGRVLAEHRRGYYVALDEEDLLCRMAGRLARDAHRARADRPAVGDWVVVEPRSDHGEGTLHAVLPRRTRLSRKYAGRNVSEQVLAANVDIVFLVHGLDTEPNPRRIERLLALVAESGARPFHVLTKRDLVDDIAAWVATLEAQSVSAPIRVVSGETGEGVDALLAEFSPGADRPPGTAILVGQSGAGKSTILNAWMGDLYQAVQEVREDGKGRHTTTGRELFVLPSGGLVIDTPGMREFGLWESDRGLPEVYADVFRVAEGCRFRDCRHGAEPDCAVREAGERGELDPARVAAFRALTTEAESLDVVRQRQGTRGPRRRRR